MTCIPRVLAAGAFLALLACGGSDDPAGPKSPTSTNGTMSALIDGQQWTAVGIAASYQNQIGTLVIGASNASNVGFGFAVPANGPGTYTVNSTIGMNANLNTGGDGWLAVGTTGSGTVTITTLTATRAAGTFSFVLQATDAGVNPQTRNVTNGQFDVTY